jgi:diketogulonate reductase-like aldo/keto reductase
VLHALGLGYRFLDTAARYGCEEQLGEAVRESGVAREQLFLTSKIWPADSGCGGEHCSNALCK